MQDKWLDMQYYDLVTHKALMSTMPTGSGWLSDSKDNSRVDFASLVVATALLTLDRYYSVGGFVDRVTEIN
jgi:hypothetical protein